MKKIFLTIVATKLMLFLIKPQSKLALVLAFFYGFLAFLEDRKS